ncbi:DUF397 domain-containing protein [Micromonospora sp. WMMD1120]|uniref:DUF397 domain-containing protein n=1 Tax=Micromonospora sp. WMMD1120 TaxID=3016106 RepID=UPI0024160F39|nr:DUF397 domain-containing protein [Micromonospora sp. WMMD1120]MDG4805893.1 DUF397 domain-containing protein [Micromonospora sp. WMMD1120]
MNLTGASRRTSSRSGNGECVGVADDLPGFVGVRDSRDPSGPVLVFAAPARRRTA